MATEVENNAPAMETKEIKEEIAAGDNKAEEAKQEVGAGDATTPKEKEPAPPKVVVHKSNYEKDIVYLYQFSRTPLLPSLSPYCLKVETWLRLAGIKYEVSEFKLNVFLILIRNFEFNRSSFYNSIHSFFPINIRGNCDNGRHFNLFREASDSYI